ncbi:MASE1 domain-containing protein [Rouxiella badensis]|nr:MASE1 domain-containing protein [Rouxiella badensis]
MTRWAFPLKWLLFSLSYLALAFLCLETRDSSSLSSAIWLPAGLTLGILCSSPLSRWPLWLVSAGTLHVLASYLHHRPMDITLVFAVTNLVILCLSAHVWLTLMKGRGIASNLSAMALFISIVLAASALGGMTILFALRMLAYPTVVSHFVSWSISNATGCLAMAPLFMVNQLVINKRVKSQNLLLITGILLITLALFLPDYDYQQNIPTVDFSLYLLFGLILLSLLFITERRLALLQVIIALIISITTIYNRGPFADSFYSDNNGITASQLYLLAIFISALLVRSGITDLYFLKRQSERQILLMSANFAEQKSYPFRINVTQQKVIWTDVLKMPDALPQAALMTPAQILGRMHPDDRTLFSPWFMGANKTSVRPFTQPVRLILSSSDFCKGHIALLSDHDNNANLYLNGVLTLYQVPLPEPVRQLT